MRQRRDALIAAGQCPRCTKPAAPGLITCRPCREKERVRANRGNQRAREKVFHHYGTVCACPGCGASEWQFLTIDHIAGGGNRHRRELAKNRLIGGSKDYKVRGGVNFYKWLIRAGFPEGYRTLCHNCNCSRGFFGYCPHERTAAGVGVPGEIARTQPQHHGGETSHG